MNRVWGFKVDREFPDGPLGYEPLVIGDRVRWHTNNRLKGTVLLVGPTVQGYKYALPLVAVQWDGLPREELAKISLPSKQAAGEICVSLRTELVITEKVTESDPLRENQRWLQEAFGQEDA